MPLTELNYYGKHQEPCIFMIDFGGENARIFSLAEATRQRLWIQFPTFSSPCLPIALPTLPFRWQTQPPTLEAYTKAYQIVVDNLYFGNSYLLNLSAPTAVATDWTLEEIFQHSQAKYKVFGQDEFVCFSPETFIQIQDGKIFSYPMKGTIDATLPDAENLILQDKKELAEHYTIVDLIRNDLSQVATQVRVARFRYVDKIQTHTGKALLQVSSEIMGNLPADYQARLGDTMMQLLPAGSITGAPKRKTVEVIQEAESIFSCGNEPYKRGFYTGICGYFDGKNLDTAVMIRFLQRVGKEFYFKSGGGITTQSTLESEYQELIQKVYIPLHDV